VATKTLRERMLEVAKSYAKNALTARAMTEARISRKIADRLRDRFGKGEDELEPALVAEVVAEVVDLCRSYAMVDDAAYAGHKAESGIRRGKSRRATAMDMQHKGLAAPQVAEALEDYDSLAAALNYMRRKKAGPYAPGDQPQDKKDKAFASFLRNGFSFDLWRRAGSMEPDEIDEYLSAAR